MRIPLAATMLRLASVATSLVDARGTAGKSHVESASEGARCSIRIRTSACAAVATSNNAAPSG